MFVIIYINLIRAFFSFFLMGCQKFSSFGFKVVVKWDKKNLFEQLLKENYDNNIYLTIHMVILIVAYRFNNCNRMDRL